MTVLVSRSVTFTTATTAVCAPSRRRKAPTSVYLYLASYADQRDWSVEVPYRKVKTYDEEGRLIDQVVTDEVEYITAQSGGRDTSSPRLPSPWMRASTSKRQRVSARRRDEILEIDAEKVDYMDVSPPG